MDPRQIFKNVSEGNETISFNGVISVIKEEENFTKDVPAIVALSNPKSEFNQQQFVETINLVRRYKKEYSAAIIDEQQIITRNNYLFKALTSESEIEGRIIKERCERSLDKSKDLKNVLKKLIKKVNVDEMYSNEKFNEMLKPSTSSSSSSSSSSSDDEKTFSQKAIEAFDKGKDEGRDSMPLSFCHECIKKGGLKKDDEIALFLELADVEEMGELQRDNFLRILYVIETYYYVDMDEKYENKEILDEEYRPLIAKLLYGLINVNQQETIRTVIVNKMLEKICGKKINGRPVQMFQINKGGEEVTFHQFLLALKDEEEEIQVPQVEVQPQIPQQPPQQQIPQENVFSSNEEEIDYNPSKFTVFYLRQFFNLIDLLFGQ